ncbi:MAG: SCO family protein [Chloroflexi bacterium]|nr:SCO family protein [Chloroflexota bacterium]
MLRLMEQRSIRSALVAVLALALAGTLASFAWGEVRQHPGGERRPNTHHHEESPAVRYPEVSGFAVVERRVVEPATPAPAFRLVDRSGAPVALEDLRGKVVVISFLYTNCPEACPLLTGHYLQLQDTFAAALAQGDLALVFITTDPERDTTERLQAYTLGRGGKWYFLTGDPATLRTVWDGYGIYREVQQRLQEIVVYHSYKTYVLDREGRIRVKYTGVWSPEDVTADLRGLLDAR